MPVNGHSTARQPRARRLRGALEDVYRAAILDAAERVFGARGFTAARMADVAAAAGLAAGTLYNYFDSKDAIFWALFRRRGEEFMARLEGLAAARRPVEESLTDMVRASLEHFDTHRAMFAVFAELGPEACAAERGAEATAMRERYVALFETVLRRARAARRLRPALQVRDLALYLSGVIYGLTRCWGMDGRAGRLADRANLIVDLFLEGAKPRHRSQA